MSDERRDPIDLHALAEDVASDRLTMSAAEARIRGAIGDAEAGRRAIDELRSLTRALGAVRTHASAWREEQKDARADRRAAADRDVTAYRRAAESHSAPSHGPGVVAPAPVGGGAAPGRGYRRGRGRGRGRARVVAGGLVSLAVVVVVAIAVASLRSAPGIGGPSGPGSADAGGSRVIASLPTVIRPTGSPSTSGPMSGPTAIVSASASSSGSTTVPPPTSAASTASVPRIAAFWSVGVVTGKLTLWRWDLASAHFVDQVDVHVRTGPTVVGYDVLVSPDFRRFAVHEWGQQSQTLVFETTGRLLWTSPSGMPQTIDMAWSNDGTKIALAAVPAPWTVLTFGTDGSVSQMSYNLPGGSTYGLLSFDAGGLHLIGFKSPGKVGFWQNPVSLDLAAGSDTVPAALDAFPTGLSSSATQSWVNQINPRSGDVLSQTGTSSWQVTSAGTTLLDASRVESLAWADANTIVMVGPPPTAPVPPLGATFPAADALGIWTASAEHPNTTHVVRRYAGMFMPSGAGYSPVGLLAAGHGYAVVYVGAPPCCVGGPIGQGLSKVELVDLQSGTAAAGTVPDGAPAGTTFSFAGWLP